MEDGRAVLCHPQSSILHPRWQERGLPVAGTVREAFGLKGDASDWQACPYVPENGFGEVAIDCAWQWENAL